MNSLIRARRSAPEVIVGNPAQVWAAVTRSRELGRLVSVERAELLPGDRLRVVARLRAARSPESWSTGSSWRSWALVALKVAVVLALVAGVLGLGWLVVVAVMELVAMVAALVAWVQAHLVLIVAGAVALLLLVLRFSGHPCRGLHCGGCRR